MSTVESERPGLPRAAKIAIVAVAVLAVGGAGTAFWLAQSGSLEAGAVAPSPSASASPSASISPSASASPSAEPTPSTTAVANALTDPTFRAGESPSPNGWFGGWGVEVTCGMPAAELTAQASDEAVLTVAGTATETADGWTLPVEIVSQDAVDLGREPRLAWFQDGRLVDLTTTDIDGGPYASLAGGGQTLSADATGDHLWGCGDLTDVFDDGALGSAPERVAVRPAGTYDVVAVLPTGQGVLLSEPVPLTTVSAVAPASFREGFADDRLAFGAEVTCGMPVTDLPESDARFTVDVLGSPSFEMPHWKLPIRVVGSEGGAGDGEPASAVLLWVQDGVVVDVGTQDTHFDPPSLWFAGGPTFSGGSLDDVAAGAAVDTCMPGADGTTFRSYRPAGDYEVIPFVRIGYGDDVPLVLGDPVPVTVGERGRP